MKNILLYIKQPFKWVTRLPIVMFLTNAFKFRRELAQHSWWDYHFTLLMMRRSFMIIKDGLENKGIEVEEHRKPKIQKLSRVIRILDNICDSRYIDLAEYELGGLRGKSFAEETEEEKAHNRKVFMRADEIQNSEWHELWSILEGQDKSDFISGKKKFEEWFDGSDMRSWWD